MNPQEHRILREMADNVQLVSFLRESIRIEGIRRMPTRAEIECTKGFLALQAPRIIDLEGLVKVYQPDARLRDNPFLNVRVGDHIAPEGGDAVVDALKAILVDLPKADPWDLHVRYETLHPFTDGNGRSGRTLWAWQMVRLQDGLPLGFLHQWYYQTLSKSRRPVPRPVQPGERGWKSIS